MSSAVVGILYVAVGFGHSSFCVIRFWKLKYLRRLCLSPVFLVLTTLAWPVALVWRVARWVCARRAREVALLQRVADLEDRLAAALRETTACMERSASLEMETAACMERSASLEMALDREAGPHCLSCGNAMDPDCCWCGTEQARHRWEGHDCVPMGCDCGRDPRDVDWRKVASNLRSLLWRARQDLEAHDEALATACAVQVDLALELQGLQTLSPEERSL